jgi:hypothetical protein
MGREAGAAMAISELIPNEERKISASKPEDLSMGKVPDGDASPSGLANLQRQVGNAAVQRLLIQRSGDGAFDLDDETAGRINRERSAGQELDEAAQQQMSQATGHDFSDVKVHTSPEANTLNEQLGAKAFTTGKDIYFREGAYQPATSSGRELLSHELTHVIQQSTGAVNAPVGRMAVNAPGDAYEQQAEAVSKAVTSASAAGGIQRETEEGGEEVQGPVQRQEVEKDDEEKLE